MFIDGLSQEPHCLLRVFFDHKRAFALREWVGACGGYDDASGLRELRPFLQESARASMVGVTRQHRSQLCYRLGVFTRVGVVAGHIKDVMHFTVQGKADRE